MADLYALGVLLYGALTEGYPFNPELSPERLVAAITLRTPRAPHRINPKVPKSLSAITMKLLEKRPESRFPSAEALWQALWEANKDRTSREWKTSLDLPESGPAPITDEEMQERKQAEEEARRAAQTREQGGDEAPAEKDSTEASNTAADTYAPMNTVPVRHTEVIWTWARVRRPLLRVAAACMLVAGLVALATWWSTNRQSALPSVGSHSSAPPLHAEPGGKLASPSGSPEARAAAASSEAVPHPVTSAARAMPSEDSSSVTMPTNVPSKQPPTAIRAARKWVGAAITCSALTGCPGAQVRPAPPAENCPPGAVETMAKWNIEPGENHLASFLVRGEPRVITVSEGRTTVYTKGGQFEAMPTVKLSGRLIFADRVYGRLTEAEVDGRTFPVCFELEDHTERGRGLVREPNGSADTPKVFSSVTVKAVSKFE